MLGIGLELNGGTMIFGSLVTPGESVSGLMTPHDKEKLDNIDDVIESVTTAKEDKSNKVTTLSSSSTDTQYPSAKCVYDLIGDVETILTVIDVGGGIV